jgi:tripartite-type tricarboxylate transporter receptor subunit TctC
LTLAGFGPATTTQIALETLKCTAKFDMTFIPYSGDAPAINALLGEHVTAIWVNFPTVAEHINSGKLRALATLEVVRIAWTF